MRILPHWLDVGKKLTKRPPCPRQLVPHHNEEGKFCGLASARNLRVLKWVLDGGTGKGLPLETVIGAVTTRRRSTPTPGAVREYGNAAEVDPPEGVEAVAARKTSSAVRRAPAGRDAPGARAAGGKP